MKEISREEIQKAIDDCHNTWDAHTDACATMAKLIPQLEDNEENHVFEQPGDGLVVCVGLNGNTPINAELIEKLRQIKSRKKRLELLEELSI